MFKNYLASDIINRTLLDNFPRTSNKIMDSLKLKLLKFLRFKDSEKFGK